MKDSTRKSGVHESSPATLKKIGKKLKDLRKAAGYKNSDDFAYDHDINRSQYGKYEAGAMDMRISSLQKTVNALGITLEEFFKDGLDQD